MRGARSPHVDAGMSGDSRQLFRDTLRREDKIDATGGDRAAWHRVEARGLVLRERNAAFGFDRLQPQRSVRSRAGKNDADGPLALVIARASKNASIVLEAPLPASRGVSFKTPWAMLKIALGGMT